MDDAQRLAIFAPYFSDGGVDKMLLNLARGVAGNEIPVDLLVSTTDHPSLNTPPERVNIVKLNHKKLGGPLHPLVDYLKQTRPTALLSGKLRDDETVLVARRMANVTTRLVFRVGLTLTDEFKQQNAVKRLYQTQLIRRTYPLADQLVAVSRGVAEQLASMTGLPAERIRVIPNPVVTPELGRLAIERVDHPWFHDPHTPIIMSAGRLTKAKDFATLIRAFAELRQGKTAKLVIFGEGGQRAHLQTLINKLGLQEHVDLAGHTDNPYAYMAKADLFALSSLQEGSPNGLIEALALALPVVATDCPSGPREVLENGRHGKLVPVGDSHALAHALSETLDTPPERLFLQQAAHPYTLWASAEQYLDVLGLVPPEEDDGFDDEDTFTFDPPNVSLLRGSLKNSS